MVLANLARQTPSEVLATLVSGAPGIDGGAPDEGSPTLDFSAPDIQKKTESIIACIAYSHSNLSAEAQQLLLCLAPFTGIIDLDRLPQYTEQLKAQPALAHLDFEQWPAVLQAAAAWGLLTEHPQVGNALQPQPTLPYFLRNRLRELPEIQAAIETAFRLHYDGYAGALAQAAQSKDPKQRQMGLFLIAAEYENMYTALDFALAAASLNSRPLRCTISYIDAMQDQACRPCSSALRVLACT